MEENNNDKASLGIQVICFLLPIVGLIIFAVNVSTRPKYAKECLIASLLPIVIIFSLWLVSYIIFIITVIFEDEEIAKVVSLVIFVIIIQSLFWGVISGNIYKGKGGKFKTGFIFGFILGIIGLLIVAVQRDKNEVSNYNPTETLEKLQKLKECGAISQQEFEESKQKILSKL